MTAIHRFFLRVATVRLALALGVALFSLMAAVNLLDLPASVPRIRALSGGRTILDLMPMVSPDRAFATITAYGEEGRRQYFLLLGTVDVVLPLLAAGFLGVALTLAFRSRGALVWVNVIGVVALGLDYLENAGILAMLVAFPRRLDIVARLTGVTTLLKHGFYLGGLLVLLAGALWSIVGRDAKDA